MTERNKFLYINKYIFSIFFFFFQIIVTYRQQSPRVLKKIHTTDNIYIYIIHIAKCFSTRVDSILNPCIFSPFSISLFLLLCITARTHTHTITCI